MVVRLVLVYKASLINRRRAVCGFIGHLHVNSVLPAALLDFTRGCLINVEERCIHARALAAVPWGSAA